MSAPDPIPLKKLTLYKAVAEAVGYTGHIQASIAANETQLRAKH